MHSVSIHLGDFAIGKVSSHLNSTITVSSGLNPAIKNSVELILKRGILLKYYICLSNCLTKLHKLGESNENKN